MNYVNPPAYCLCPRCALCCAAIYPPDIGFYLSLAQLPFACPRVNDPACREHDHLFRAFMEGR